MSKKYIFMVFVSLGIFLSGILFVSSICCEKLNDGGQWCQSANDESSCDQDYSIFETQTCNEVPECSGVCVNGNSGECSENVGEIECIEGFEGTWYEEPIEEIVQCQEVCCVLGDEVAFVTPNECRKLFSDYNVNGIIRDDITDRNSCEELSQVIQEGACLIDTDLERTCVRSTSTECNSNNIEWINSHLGNTVAGSEVDLSFRAGILCTAEELFPYGCAKSKDTTCADNKVYFTDTCGNKANVYDESKFDGQGSNEYWREIKNPSDLNDVCQINGPSDSCGNCEPVGSGTVCQDTREANKNEPINNRLNPTYGENVCADLSCKLSNGEIKKHGESWCGGTEGALIGIEGNPDGIGISEESRNLLKNQDEYNIPGSRYNKMICSFGEILVEECADYRNEICTQETTSEDKTEATCEINTWRNCFELTSKESCEDTAVLCKWVPGYRPDFELIDEKSEGLRSELQGSCVPLIAPGFDFWNGDTQGTGICFAGFVQDFALYETGAVFSPGRDSFSEFSSKSHAEHCVNGCYLIPGYGSEFYVEEELLRCEDSSDCGAGNACFNGYCVGEELYSFYDESEYKLPNKVKDYFLSLRRGQYCHKDGEEDHWLTGKIGIQASDLLLPGFSQALNSCEDGRCYDCTPTGGSDSKDEEKERDFPLFLTHQQWLSSVSERSRSLGDCGYKPNTIGEFSSPESEIVTALFQKLSQKGDVKEELSAEQIIYKAGEWVGNDSEPYNTEIYEASSFTCSGYGGICMSTVNGAAEQNCLGEIKQKGDNGESICPSQSVCCIFSDFGEENEEE
jgi:hypothetical protein